MIQKGPMNTGCGHWQNSGPGTSNQDSKDSQFHWATESKGSKSSTNHPVKPVSSRTKKGQIALLSVWPPLFQGFARPCGAFFLIPPGIGLIEYNDRKRVQTMVHCPERAMNIAVLPWCSDNMWPKIGDLRLTSRTAISREIAYLCAVEPFLNIAPVCAVSNVPNAIMRAKLEHQSKSPMFIALSIQPIWRALNAMNHLISRQISSITWSSSMTFTIRMSVLCAPTLMNAEKTWFVTWRGRIKTKEITNANDVIKNSTTKIHDGQKPFECSHCHKAFRQKEHLQIHSKYAHNNHPSFTCTQCERPYKCKSTLIRHFRNKHPEGIESCPICLCPKNEDLAFIPCCTHTFHVDCIQSWSEVICLQFHVMDVLLHQQWVQMRNMRVWQILLDNGCHGVVTRKKFRFY